MPLRAAGNLRIDQMSSVRRHMMLEACKWDPQVGDVATLAPFPLLLEASAWQSLRQTAERLTAELIAAESELLGRPELHRTLGLPWRIRRALRAAYAVGGRADQARVMRFDFHWTDTGWQISEVNSDVPGGFSEASEFPALMSPHFPGTRTAGHPGDAWADAIAAASAGGPVALLAAAGFMEDQQVIAYLARRLQARGVVALRATPSQLRWNCDQALFADTPVAALVRFVQAEWLSAFQLRQLLSCQRTAVFNSPIAMLTESKRFPLVWDDLRLPMHAWRAALPTTIDPRSVDLHSGHSFLLKSAYCNTGDTVALSNRLPVRAWREAARTARRHARSWVAQRIFRTLPIASPMGNVFACVGVYTVAGRAVGIYGRISPTPLIDFAAIDVAVLITDSEARP